MWYNVYIEIDTDNTHDDKILLTKKEPITTTQFQIPPDACPKGQYFVGIQSLAYQVKDGKKSDIPMQSDISWSSSKSNTQKKPFGVVFK